MSAVLTIAAMTSLQGAVWFHHEGEKKAEESSRRKFAVEEGDQLTMLNVYQAFVTKGKKDAGWCRRHHLNYKSMLRAVSVRTQLKRYLERFGVNVDESLASTDTADNVSEQIQRCLTTGFFAHAARMQADGTFRTVRGGTVLHAHPSSLMFVSLTLPCTDEAGR
jgi:ATP-dependent RNA helicase DDX35